MVERRRLRTILIIALSLQLALMLPAQVSATHVTACAQSSISGYVNGSTKLFTGVTGARATLEGQTLEYCTSSSDDDRMNTIWVAVDNNRESGDNGNSLVQAGRGRCRDAGNPVTCDGTDMRWWAWGRDPTAPGCAGTSNAIPFPRRISAWSSGTDEFIVARASGQWKIYVDGTLEEQVSEASICWNKLRATWSGERWDSGDAIGGSTGNKFALTGAAYQKVAAGGWFSPAFGGGACEIRTAIFDCSEPTGTSLSLWADH